jgi:glutamine amidotransferase-like uncharacterized protein
MNLIRHVVIYAGHRAHPLFGPYSANIPKRVAMFEYLNRFRKNPWSVETIDGDCLTDRLKLLSPSSTLLVIPAGQSTCLDKVLSLAQCHFIKNYLESGAYGYFNCGSAYMVSEKRIFHDLCEESPEVKKPIVKPSQLPLFDGVAEGPLCPYPGKKYNVGFFSDAVKITNGSRTCTIYLSGGGSFHSSKGNCTVLLRYAASELKRLGISEAKLPQWENAAIMTRVGKGKALLSMFHPYYNPHDFDPETYEKAFPDCGTNWRQIRDSLTPLEERMDFVYQTMIQRLESIDF